MDRRFTLPFVATPQGIMLGNELLVKSMRQGLSPYAQHYIDRAEALLKQIKPEDWDIRTPHHMNDVPILAKVQMMLALANPVSLDKRGYNRNEARVPAGNHEASGEWTSTDGVTAADLKNPRYKGLSRVQIKKQKFVDAHLAAAEKGAKQLHVPVENILGISAVESGWGRDKFPVIGNNYFGQHSPAPYETGSFSVKRDASVKGAIFDSYSDSLQAFIQARGHLVQGIRDSKEFVQALQDSGAYGIIKTGSIKHPVYSPDPAYVPKVTETIKGLSAYIKRARQ